MTTRELPDKIKQLDVLVQAYLGIGTGIAGVHPQIMVPDRATVPVPYLIVKTGSPA